MTTATILKDHPAAGLFPLLDGADREKLKADIQANGQRELITLYQGEILDGRNRYRILTELGIAPRTKDVTNQCTDPVALALSLNLHRRHLTISQRAAIAADALSLLEIEAKRRQATNNGEASPQLTANLPEAEKGEAREKAAKVFKVSPRSVSDAKAIKRAAPALHEIVKAGGITINAAKSQLKQPAAASIPTTKHEFLSDAEVAVVDRLHEISRQIHELGKELRSIGEKPFGVFIHAQSVNVAVANLKGAIKAALPHAVCPCCSGKKCKDCRQTGWMPKDFYERTPEDLRRVNDKAKAVQK